MGAWSTRGVLVFTLLAQELATGQSYLVSMLTSEDVSATLQFNVKL